jgi:hypothetical protein
VKEWLSGAGNTVLKRYKHLKLRPSFPGVRETNTRPGRLYDAFMLIEGTIKTGKHIGQRDLLTLCRFTPLKDVTHAIRFKGQGATTNMWRLVKSRHKPQHALMKALDAKIPERRARSGTAAAASASAADNSQRKLTTFYKHVLNDVRMCACERVRVGACAACDLIYRVAHVGLHMFSIHNPCPKHRRVSYVCRRMLAA